MTASVPATTPKAVDIKNDAGKELNATAGAAAAQTKIQAAMLMAMNRPRDQKKALNELVEICKDEDFAEDAIYTFPRGDSTVEGLSVNIAREMARVWGNIHYGVDIVGEDETTRQIRGWAWDLETGANVSLDDAFAKLVFRRSKGWIKPDERDLRELNNRRAAILERNCILKLIPPMVKKQAERTIKDTLNRAASAAPEKKIEKMVLAFSEIDISTTELEKYLKHPISQTTPDEIVKMQGVYKSLIDGNSRWDEYVPSVAQAEQQAPSKATIDIDSLRAGTESNRGHGNENLSSMTEIAQDAKTGTVAAEGQGEKAESPYVAPTQPKNALMQLALDQHDGDKEIAKEAIRRAARHFFNKTIKVVNDLTTDEAVEIYRATTVYNYEF